MAPMENEHTLTDRESEAHCPKLHGESRRKKKKKLHSSISSSENLSCEKNSLEI